MRRPTNGAFRRAVYISSVRQDASPDWNASADRGSFPKTPRSPMIQEESEGAAMHETDELILKYTPDEALAEIMHRSERIAL